MPVEELGQEPAPPLITLQFLEIVRQVSAQGVCQCVDGLLLIAVLPLLGLGHGRTGYVAEVAPKLRPLVFQPVPQVERREAIVAVVALDLGEEVLSFLPLPKLKPGLELDDALIGIAQFDPTLESVERFKALDGVALDRCAHRLAHRPVEVDEHPASQELVDLLLARAMASGEALHSGRFVGRVVVDVQVRVGLKAVHDEVDECFEGAPFRARGDGAVLDRPEGVERRLPVLTQTVGLDDAEEIVDAVDLVRLEEGVALDVEEEIARGGFREHEQPLVGNQLALAVARRLDAIGDCRPKALAPDLDFRLRLDSRQRLAASAVETIRKRLRGLGKSGACRHVDRVQGAPLA